MFFHILHLNQNIIIIKMNTLQRKKYALVLCRLYTCKRHRIPAISGRPAAPAAAPGHGDPLRVPRSNPRGHAAALARALLKPQGAGSVGLCRTEGRLRIIRPCARFSVYSEVIGEFFFLQTEGQSTLPSPRGCTFF